MSTAPQIQTIPELTLGWRLKLALHHAGLTSKDVADRLGYSRQHISYWLGDRGTPRPVVLAQWALLTGVDAGWLRTGEPPSDAPGPDGGGLRTGNRSAAVTSLDAWRHSSDALDRQIATAA